MDAELDYMLVNSFPNLYRNRYASPQITSMCWGFPGNGWLQIIWNLSEKLEKIILSFPESERMKYCASQVKEKFGTLNFSCEAYTDEMREAIEEARRLSRSTCENCGAPGQLSTVGWHRVLCSNCFYENDKKLKERCET